MLTTNQQQEKILLVVVLTGSRPAGRKGFACSPIQFHNSSSTTRARAMPFAPPKSGPMSLFDVPRSFLAGWGGNVGSGGERAACTPVVVDKSGKWSDWDQQRLEKSLTTLHSNACSESSTESDIEDGDGRNSGAGGAASVKSEVSQSVRQVLHWID